MADLIVDYLERNLEAYVEDLRYLAGIDSGTYDKAGVDAVQTWFETKFTELGFATERKPQEQWGDDLLARKHGSGTGRVLMIGHADTVFPAGTAAERPLSFDGDKILGPGTCDMKAGLLTGLYAMRALDQAGWVDFDTISFLIVSDEEIEQRHSAELLKAEGPNHHAALTLEAARANGDVVTSRKATRWYRVEAAGKSAHAGVEPEKGASATLAIAHVIVEAFKLNGRKPGMTINPGRITGGANPNIVADAANVLFDLRAWSNADLEELAGALAGRCSDRVGARRQARADQGRRRHAGDGTLAWNNPARESRHRHCRSRSGFRSRALPPGAGRTSATPSTKAHLGLDGLGPIGGLDHGPDEYIERSSIVPRTALLAKLLMAICADKELAHD